MKHLSLLIVILLSLPALAEEYLPHGPTEQMIQAMSEANSQQALHELFAPRDLENNNNVQAFYEYDKTGYLLMSDGDYYGVAEEMKQILASELPEDSTLIVYTRSSSKNHVKELFNYYSKYIDSGRLKILQVPHSGSNDFWSRDNLPIPVWNDGAFNLVDARYYYNFEPDTFFSDLFAAPLMTHNYFYEGGNFMVNSRGECIVVNRRRSYPGGTSDTGAIPDTIFTNNYGCKKLLRFKHIKGIGHADEVIKFMSDDIVVTDTEEYVETLENAGYTVYLLPEPDRSYETYVNSLIVNDVLFVPVFGEDGDQKAIDIYNSLNLGFKVVTIPTRQLATQGQGGIHCITMNYPDVPLQEIAENLGGWIYSGE